MSMRAVSAENFGSTFQKLVPSSRGLVRVNVIQMRNSASIFSPFTAANSTSCFEGRAVVPAWSPAHLVPVHSTMAAIRQKNQLSYCPVWPGRLSNQSERVLPYKWNQGFPRSRIFGKPREIPLQMVASPRGEVSHSISCEKKACRCPGCDRPAKPQ